MIRSTVLFAAAAALAIACSSESADGPDAPANPESKVDFGEPVKPPKTSGASSNASSSSGAVEPGPDGAPLAAVPPFITKVVSFTPGKCAGFGKNQMPDIVLGPPKGAGSAKGSFDVVSLGKGGEIVLSLEPNAIVDGEGADFVVYENAFIAAGTTEVFAEPGEVSVSEDGVEWKTFPCTATEAPWGACAGWHSVEEDGSGGDPYDLAEIGVKRARFIRIVDKTTSGVCNSQGPVNYGFDLDAIRALHSERL